MNMEEINKPIEIKNKQARLEYCEPVTTDNIEDLKNICDDFIEKMNSVREKYLTECWSSIEYFEDQIDINIYRRETDEEYLDRKQKSDLNNKLFKKRRALEILKEDLELLNKLKSDVSIDEMLKSLKNEK